MQHHDHITDLRSDTVTRPTDAMRKAMSAAPVGDDVYGEDPTVRRLEELAAELVGGETAVFVPSGTMGNQIAVHLHTRPGTEVIGESQCHIFNYEMGAMATLSGALPRAIDGECGLLEPKAVAAAIQPDTGYSTPTSLLALENTHNLAGGRIMARQRVDELIDVARQHDLPVHLDGARIFNAAAALECSAAELARGFDTVMFCLSKGLAAPVGSLLVCRSDHEREIRRIRKMFGGGMRQAGIIAAAGIVALEQMTDRLADDNRRAHTLAKELAEIRGIELDPGLVETNIVFFRLAEDAPYDAKELAARLSERGILVHALGGASVRMVTHHHITDADIERAVEAVRLILETP